MTRWATRKAFSESTRALGWLAPRQGGHRTSPARSKAPPRAHRLVLDLAGAGGESHCGIDRGEPFGERHRTLEVRRWRSRVVAKLRTVRARDRQSAGLRLAVCRRRSAAAERPSTRHVERKRFVALCPARARTRPSMAVVRRSRPAFGRLARAWISAATSASRSASARSPSFEPELRQRHHHVRCVEVIGAEDGGEIGKRALGKSRGLCASRRG